MKIMIQPDGTVRCVYGEQLDLLSLGLTDIKRASHVEPLPSGDWLVDLEPVGGPEMGPFAKRSEALAAELQWLEENWLVQGSQ